MGFFSNTRRRRSNQLDELNGLIGGQDTSWQTAQQPVRGKGGGGFFGQGGAGRNIAGYIGDALAQMGGIQPVYAPAMEQQRRLSLHQMQREQEQQDYLFRQKFEQENAPPPNNDTINDYNFIRERLGEAEARRYLENRANPMQMVTVQNPDGSQEQRWIRPPASQPAAPSQAPAPGTIEGNHRFRGGDPADPANWEPVNQGGAAPSNGPRRFR